MKTNRRVCKKSELANPLQTIHCGVGNRITQAWERITPKQPRQFVVAFL